MTKEGQRGNRLDAADKHLSAMAKTHGGDNFWPGPDNQVEADPVSSFHTLKGASSEGEKDFAVINQASTF